MDDKSLGVKHSVKGNKSHKNRIEELRLQFDFDQWCNSGPDNHSDEKLTKTLRPFRVIKDVIFISMGCKDKDGRLHMGLVL